MGLEGVAQFVASYCLLQISPKQHPMSYDASRKHPAYKHMQGVYRDIFGEENSDHFSFFLKEKAWNGKRASKKKSC